MQYRPGLQKKEYKYIRTNLEESRAKILRLQKITAAHRTLFTFQERDKTLILTKRIYGIVKEEPKRFYDAEDFFLLPLRLFSRTNRKICFPKQPTGERQEDLPNTF